MGKSGILEAFFDEETGMSVCVKGNRDGTVCKQVFLHEEDADIATEFDGCQFAEWKCDIELARKKAYKMYQRYLGAKRTRSDMAQRGYDGSDVMADLYRVVSVAKRDYIEARNRYKDMEAMYPGAVDRKLEARREGRARMEALIASRQ